MKSFARVLLPLSAFFFFIPQASAGELGDALLNTMSADQWAYTSTMEMSMKQDLEKNMPFEASAWIKEEGGKMGKNYGEVGEMNIRVSGFQNLPAEINDVSYVNVLMKYRADYEDTTLTGFAQMDSVQVTTDSKKIQKVTEMMNQIAKMFTGKAFRMSSKELADALSGLGMTSEEDLLLLNAMSGNSIDKTMQAFAEAIDGLLQSGVLIDTVQNTSIRKSRRIESSQYHLLTLAKSMTPQQAEVLRKTIIRFVEKTVPAMAPQIATEFQNLSSEELANDLNEALMALQEVNTQMEVEIASGLVQSFYFHMDLENMNINANVAFDYSKGFPMVVSRDEKNLIDINKIFEGFLSIAEMGSSQVSSYEEPSYDYQTDYYVVLDTIDEIDRYVWDICGEDAGCRRMQLMALKRELKQLRREEVISRQEYLSKMKDLNTLR